MALTAEQEAWIAQASREDIAGWIYVRISGAPFARGFQYGYLIADQWAPMLRVYKYMTYQDFGMEYDFFVEHAVAMHKDKLGDELTREMEGIAAGLTAAGQPATIDDIIGINAWMEITDYWWPANHEKFAKQGPQQARGTHCSAFVATGSYTADGKIVLGHTSWTDFWQGAFENVVLDITPESGHRIVMQTGPGWIASMSDYYVMDSGLIVTETTIAGFNGYDEEKVPEYVRARNACQYASTIDEWITTVRKDDNGGYANTWLIGDIKSNEIARYEEGLIYTDTQTTTDGYFYGNNVPFYPPLQHLECRPIGFNDIRSASGARRVRWEQLLNQHKGEIDVEVGKTMIADTYDPYLGYNNPNSRTICSHIDAEPSLNGEGVPPYQPFGSVDGKVASAADVAKVSFWGRMGRADGVAFDADEHFRQHPQWAWQKGYVASRPSQPYVYFDNGTTKE
ncbi:C45 family autoproteolytic acyltransferase/hydrolase [Microbacterium koreense]|uniref:C45 family autoproteolytic acyltransferase/hydrolase n=1 Tax=Microbacterium koreense TaxID=323761 RepID=A0ABW2ZUC1_9MICO